MEVHEEETGTKIEKQLTSLKKYIGAKFNSETNRQRLGLPTGCYLFNSTASADNLRRFADGVGDLNPRFRDSEYAQRTKYGRLVASPMFLASVCHPGAGAGSVISGEPESSLGARGFHSGSEWEFFQPVLEGDVLDFTGVRADVEIKQSKFSGQMIVASCLVQYRNQRSENVGLVKGFVHTSSSDRVAKTTGKYDDIAKPYRYSDEEIVKIQDDITKEVEMRGNRPRYWEDVAEGESLGYLVVGPYSIMDSIAYTAGAWHNVRGSRLKSTFGKQASSTCFDPRTNLYVDSMQQHLDESLARSVGAPGIFIGGIERECHESILFTNWMGDDGFLWKYSNQFRRFVCSGDICWYQGRIVKKYIDDGKCCLDIEHQGDNQRRETVSAGKATVILPSKVHGQVKYPPARSIEDVFRTKK